MNCNNIGYHLKNTGPMQATYTATCNMKHEAMYLAVTAMHFRQGKK